MIPRETVTGAEALQARIELANLQLRAQLYLLAMRQSFGKDLDAYRRADRGFEAVMREIEALEERVFG